MGFGVLIVFLLIFCFGFSQIPHEKVVAKKNATVCTKDYAIENVGLLTAFFKTDSTVSLYHILIPPFPSHFYIFPFFVGSLDRGTY